MKPEINDPLDDFLTFCNTQNLADGDFNAGTNVLAVMLCSLANIARPGSSVTNNAGKTYPVNSNLLVSGAFSSKVVNDTITTELIRLQNNLSLHLKRFSDNKEKHDLKKQYTEKVFAPDPTANVSEENLEQLLQQSGVLSNANSSLQWASVLQSPPNPSFDDILKNHRFLVIAHNQTDLHDNLFGTHLKSPLIIQNLNKSSFQEGFSELFSAISSGSYAPQKSEEVIKGSFLITDSTALLNEFPKINKSLSSHIQKVVWLVDGFTGPEITRKEPEAVVKMMNMSYLYKKAVASILGSRLDHRKLDPINVKADMVAHQHRWVNFLKSMEGQLPGISGTAKNLFASLVFGFQRIYLYNLQFDGPKFQGSLLQSLEAFAQFIIFRMANKRSAMLITMNSSLENKHKKKLMRFLNEYPHNTRSLCRRFDKMCANQCNMLLGDLEKQGLVKQVDGNKWKVTEAALNTNTTTQIEV